MKRSMNQCEPGGLGQIWASDLRTLPGVFVGLGVFLSVTAAENYAARGFSWVIVGLWAAALLLAGSVFWVKRDRTDRPLLDASGAIGFLPLWIVRRVDLMIALGLFGLFSVFYCTGIYYIPWQMNSDEVVIMNLMRALDLKRPLDIFGMSGHFDFPAGAFILFGQVAKAAGGIDFFHVRLTHALFGAVGVSVSYFFFRLGLGPLYALAAAMVLGYNHALFAISKMAMRENSAMLVVLVAGY
jgi:hypothetical protein